MPIVKNDNEIQEFKNIIISDVGENNILNNILDNFIVNSVCYCENERRFFLPSTSHINLKLLEDDMVVVILTPRIVVTLVDKHNKLNNGEINFLKVDDDMNEFVDIVNSTVLYNRKVNEPHFVVASTENFDSNLKYAISKLR